MRPPDTLPLGVDIGATRTRVALVARTDAGGPQLIAVAARPTGTDAAAAIADARLELRTPERRCVLAVRAPDAVLRTIAFPPMSPFERRRAARFEAARFVAYPPDDADVRVVRAGVDRYVVGIARRAAIERDTGAARRAGLRPIAVDDAAFALARAFPHVDALVDVGDGATMLAFAGDPVPSVQIIAGGGRAFTAAIVASLGVDAATAEERKRTLGLGGAGEVARDALIEHLASAVAAYRASSASEVRAIVLTGNGARVPGLAESLERAVAIPARLGTLDVAASRALPYDVVRAASPDWGLAYGLALWECAA